MIAACLAVCFGASVCLAQYDAGPAFPESNGAPASGPAMPSATVLRNETGSTVGVSLAPRQNGLVPQANLSVPIGPRGAVTSAVPPEIDPNPRTQKLSGTSISAQRAAQGLQVLKVDVRGNKSLSLDKIKPYIRTRVGRAFDSDQLEEDVRRLDHTHMFIDVKTYVRVVQGGCEVAFDIVERPILREVKFVGNEYVTKKALQKEADLKPGDPLDTFAVEEARRKLEAYYKKKGYSKARVTLLEGDKPEDRKAIFLINEGVKQKVQVVVFEGNTIATDARLRTQIDTKTPFLYLFSGEFKRSDLDEDVNRLIAYYRGLGFFNVEIGREVHEYDGEDKYSFDLIRSRIGREFNQITQANWVVVTFVIHEGPRFKIRNVSVNGNTKYLSDTLLRDIKLKSGDYFNQSQMTADTTMMQDMYGGVGYAFADVKADIRFLEEPGTLDLVYNVKEGAKYRVDRIDVAIKGEFPHTKITTVLNRLSIHPGDVVDTREIRASERRLKFSGLFENNPAAGETPKLVFSPPESEDGDLEGRGQSQTAGRPGSRPNVRNQSPEPSPDEERVMTLRLEGTAVNQEQWNREQSAAPQGYIYADGSRPTMYPTLQVLAQTPQNQQNPIAYQQQNLQPYQAQYQRQDQTQYPPQNPRQYQTDYQAGYQPAQAAPQRQESYSQSYGQSYPAQQSQQPAAQRQEQTTRQNVWPAPADAQRNYGEPTVVRGQYTDEGRSTPSLPSRLRWLGGDSSRQAASSNGVVQTAYNETQDAAYPQTNPQQSYQQQPQQYQQQGYPQQQYAQADGQQGYSQQPNGAAPQQNLQNQYLAASEMPPPERMVQPIFGQNSPFMSGRAPDEPMASLPINIPVNETQTGRFMLGVGVNSDSGLFGQVVIDEQNFDIFNVPRSWDDIKNFTAWRGNGQRLRIQAMPGTTTQTYSVNFDEPFWMDSQNGLGLGGYYYTRSFTEWYEERIGGRIAIKRQLTSDLNGEIAYRGASIGISNPIDAAMPDLAEVVGKNGLHGFSAGITHDTRDNPYLATQGHLLSFTAEQVIGTFQYPKLDLDARKYFMLHERPDGSGRHVLSVSGKVGWSGDDTPIYDRYFGGGSSSIRGFQYRYASPRAYAPTLGTYEICGGDFQALTSTEYMFPITADDMLRGVIFCDAGTVERSLSDWHDKFRVAPGFGLRITIPAMGSAPIALDFAFPVVSNPGDQKQVFSFFMGFNR